MLKGDKMGRYDTTVIGDINIDVIPEPISEEMEIRQDGQVFIDDLVHKRGGQAANFAVKSSELGSDVVFQGKVGDDRHADFLEGHLNQKGVEARLSRSGEIDTGTTVVVPWENGERFFLSHADNNSKLKFSDCCLETVKNSNHLARRGIWFSEPMLKEGNKKLLKKAKENGIETSIDLHWDPHWSKENDRADKRRKNFFEALQYADFLFGNEEEMKGLTKKNDLEAAVNKVKEKNDLKIVVHRGSEGSAIFRGSEKITIPTEEVENPKNPTGTGDVYDAAFLNAWQNGADLESAGKKATEQAVKHLKGLK
jgi:sugar/nucleoside kinase (ribokinase family)